MQAPLVSIGYISEVRNLACSLAHLLGEHFHLKAVAGEYILSMASMLLALLTAPALLATNEAIRQGQTKDRREEHRARSSNLIVRCVAPSSRSIEVDHQQVALKDNKVLTLSPKDPSQISKTTMIAERK
jgi:hypothetical protein